MIYSVPHPTFFSNGYLWYNSEHVWYNTAKVLCWCWRNCIIIIQRFETGTSWIHTVTQVFFIHFISRFLSIFNFLSHRVDI
jgi:hypothetical protein